MYLSSKDIPPPLIVYYLNIRWRLCLVFIYDWIIILQCVLAKLFW